MRYLVLVLLTGFMLGCQAAKTTALKDDIAADKELLTTVTTELTALAATSSNARKERILRQLAPDPECMPGDTIGYRWEGDIAGYTCSDVPKGSGMVFQVGVDKTYALQTSLIKALAQFQSVLATGLADPMTPNTVALEELLVRLDAAHCHYSELSDSNSAEDDSDCPSLEVLSRATTEDDSESLDSDVKDLLGLFGLIEELNSEYKRDRDFRKALRSLQPGQLTEILNKLEVMLVTRPSDLSHANQDSFHEADQQFEVAYGHCGNSSNESTEEESDLPSCEGRAEAFMTIMQMRIDQAGHKSGRSTAMSGLIEKLDANYRAIHGCVVDSDCSYEQLQSIAKATQEQYVEASRNALAILQQLTL